MYDHTHTSTYTRNNKNISHTHTYTLVYTIPACFSRMHVSATAIERAHTRDRAYVDAMPRLHYYLFAVAVRVQCMMIEHRLRRAPNLVPTCVSYAFYNMLHSPHAPHARKRGAIARTADCRIIMRTRRRLEKRSNRSGDDYNEIT